jgi:7,8-dihydropterin-6-yl-methyl-4-(beta-D-ribofuranosyl)aminobenzene 5'-phosphate synthase
MRAVGSRRGCLVEPLGPFLGGLFGRYARRMMRIALVVLVQSVLWAGPVAATPSPTPPPVHSLRILILSTMLAERAGIGEWGFAALVEVDGRRILFDTGGQPETVLINTRALGVDLSDVTDVVLSHNHSDHTTGLLPLRRAVAGKNPAALARVHVGRGIFWSRPTPDGEGNTVLKARSELEAAGIRFVEHDGPAEIAPGVWLTGPVPRVHPERNWSGTGRVQTPDGLVEDTIPEDQSLVVDTDRGLVLLTGCGHAGVVNTADYARKMVRAASLHAVVGGLHLFPLDDERLDWTADRLKEDGVENLVGAHCTGLEAVYRMRARLGLSRSHAVVGAVGASFELGKGIDPLLLAR